MHNEGPAGCNNASSTEMEDISTTDVSMMSPCSTGYSNSPNLNHFIIRKTRFINTPNGNYDDRGTNGSNGKPTLVKQLVSTPVTASSSAPKRVKRDDVRVNPFEKHLLDQLHKSNWSPTVFSASTPVDTPPTENWSLDQISLLNPSRIEDSPSTHQDEQVLTPQTEAKAQRAISKFFSQHIVPSPSPKIYPLDGATDDVPVTPNGDICVTDGDCSSSLNASLRRRKLDFTMSPAGIEDEDMDFNEISIPSGELLHSPGFEGGDIRSPRQLRAGMESPNLTPIRICTED